MTPTPRTITISVPQPPKEIEVVLPGQRPELTLRQKVQMDKATVTWAIIQRLAKQETARLRTLTCELDGHLFCCLDIRPVKRPQQFDGAGQPVRDVEGIVFTGLVEHNRVVALAVTLADGTLKRLNLEYATAPLMAYTELEQREGFLATQRAALARVLG